jgi:hypothetical protein
MQQEQLDATDGSYTQKYKALAKVWAGVDPISASAAAYIRGVQINDSPTHKFTVRRSVPMGVATAEVGGFVKADNFIFLLSSNPGTVGRLFRILAAANNMEQDEFIEIMAKEMGTFDTSRGLLV